MDASATDISTQTLPPAEQPLLKMRAWFALYVAWLAGLTAIAAASFAQWEAGATWAAGPWVVALMCFYLSLCNALLPLPTGWLVMFAATDIVAPYAPPEVRVLLVAVCGGVATAMANLNEYHVLSHRAGAKLRGKLRQTGAYQWAFRWFERSPFQTLMLIAFVPIPVDFIRWLAILGRYPRWRYAVAYFNGRAVRYGLLAGVAVLVKLNFWQILLVQVGIIVVALLARWVTWRQSAEGSGANRAGEGAGC